ncbi:winged helix-turn-helix transcriptional regulator [Streptomyces sp. MB09-01]|uniref:winged helix-turn-helix transcriptional regulator n=1 Tax=Streptomyces sp. MB09-01 TaxID=3028666 RepID=UPI0029BCE94C|nr:winged helix-turn-helix transcriptional regulator [Streptomyces sp. MB09-01]MDX3536042.1 winged helix-turn-helix transcriptional regulator [Streptomyces sp. MB09-01]
MRTATIKVCFSMDAHSLQLSFEEPALSVDEQLKTRESDALSYVAQCESELRHSPVELVPLANLVTLGTLRKSGADAGHAQALADSELALPPITVHRATMRVVDGMHRLRAAELRGQDRIAVQFFDGDEKDAFVLSVAANVAHGLPLARADRIAAVQRIFVSHPQWSDRAVASVTGLSAKKVAEVRRGMADDEPQVAVRVGLDGRARPVNSVQGRELASELIRSNPGASLRQIARKVGISPATVADVRERIRQGVDPVPLKLRGGKPQSGRRTRPVAGTNAPMLPSRKLSDLMPIFDTLRRDPSLRFNDTGRLVLRLFDSCAHAARERRKIADSVPPHCRMLVAELFLGYAEMWRYLAEELGEETELIRSEAV